MSVYVHPVLAYTTTTFRSVEVICMLAESIEKGKKQANSWIHCTLMHSRASITLEALFSSHACAHICVRITRGYRQIFLVHRISFVESR
jgi:hypothetical protein